MQWNSKSNEIQLDSKSNGINEIQNQIEFKIKWKFKISNSKWNQIQNQFESNQIKFKINEVWKFDAKKSN